jgi:hypothetical protein
MFARVRLPARLARIIYFDGKLLAAHVALDGPMPKVVIYREADFNAVVAFPAMGAVHRKLL